MSKAREIVRTTLAASIPPTAPLFFQSINAVDQFGSGKRARIIADVTLFDGSHGTVKLEPFAWGWSIQWTHLPAGAFYLDSDNAWKRASGPGEAHDHQYSPAQKVA